jgi:hypothetical protein
MWTPEDRVELNNLVERLININYLLKLEPCSPRVHICLQIADKDLERLKRFIHEPAVALTDD